MKKRVMAMFLVFVMAMACISPAFAAGNTTPAGDGESIGVSSGGTTRASWGYIKIVWANECSEAYAYMSTYAGTAYYLKAKVYATYSNGAARGPSDTKYDYNVERVDTDTIYENERYRQFFAEGVIQDTKTSGTQEAKEESPLWEG